MEDGGYSNKNVVTWPWYGKVWYGEDRPTQAGTGQWTGAGGARRQCARST